MADTPAVQTREKADLDKIAIHYLTTKKKWKREEFRLEHKGFTKDKRCAILWAIYLKDETNPVPGAGHSVILHADPEHAAVVEELRFQ
jgi:hypothetical protein